MKQLENILHFTNINAITDTGQDHKCMSNVLGNIKCYSKTRYSCGLTKITLQKKILGGW